MTVPVEFDAMMPCPSSQAPSRDQSRSRAAVRCLPGKVSGRSSIRGSRPDACEHPAELSAESEGSVWCLWEGGGGGGGGKPSRRSRRHDADVGRKRGNADDQDGSSEGAVPLLLEVRRSRAIGVPARKARVAVNTTIHLVSPLSDQWYGTGHPFGPGRHADPRCRCA